MKNIMKKILSIIFMAFIGIAAAFAQTSDIQDTFFGVRFGTSQEAAESILMRKGIYAVSDYNQLDFYNVHLGGYEWRHCSMAFDKHGLYQVFLEHNFNWRKKALSLYNTLSSVLKKKYGDPVTDFNDKKFKFICFINENNQYCELTLQYGKSKGGDKFYYITLIYGDLNLIVNKTDEL